MNDPHVVPDMQLEGDYWHVTDYDAPGLRVTKEPMPYKEAQKLSKSLWVKHFNAKKKGFYFPPWASEWKH